MNQPHSSADALVPFGYKCAWLAIRAAAPKPVVRALQLRDVHPTRWQDAVPAAYQGSVFVTPSIQGWVLVLSSDLPWPEANGRVDACTPFLLSLGQQFPDIQFFATHRVVMCHAWARVVSGRMARQYAWIDGEVAWNVGAETPAEAALRVDAQDGDAACGTAVDDCVDEADREEEVSDVFIPSESDVMTLARQWSLDPTTLDELGFAASAGFWATFANHADGKRPNKALHTTAAYVGDYYARNESAQYRHVLVVLAACELGRSASQRPCPIALAPGGRLRIAPGLTWTVLNTEEISSMRWKYYIPHVWETPDTVWEDIYLLPDDPTWTHAPLWLTLHAIGPTTYPAHGLTARQYRTFVREKFGTQSVWIDGTEGHIHANTFTQAMLLQWARTWLEARGYAVTDFIAVPLSDLEPTDDHARLRARMGDVAPDDTGDHRTL